MPIGEGKARSQEVKKSRNDRTRAARSPAMVGTRSCAIRRGTSKEGAM
jgi:hypothetical protein